MHEDNDIAELMRSKIVSNVLCPSPDFDLSNSTTRGLAWKALVRLPPFEASEYISHVAKGFHPICGSKILDDTFRTFKTDADFHEKVPQTTLVRLLNAYAHSSTEGLDYKQGMTATAGVLLFVMPEVDAFFSMKLIYRQFIPTYIYGGLDGARAGAVLFDYALEILDPELFIHIHNRAKHITAQIYAFPSIMSFCSNTPTLSELLHIWDFFFAFGFHLNIFVCLAQVISIRKQVLSASQPMTFLRTLPRLNASKLLSFALLLLRQVPSALLADIKAHCTDLHTAQLVLAHKDKENPYIEVRAHFASSTA